MLTTTHYSETAPISQVISIRDGYLSEVPPPIIPAGQVPFDIAAWKARRAPKQPAPTPPPEVIQVENQGDEADWLEWHLAMNDQQLMSNDDLRALAVAKGKKIAPGTIDHHDAYIRDAGTFEYPDILRMYRQYAIFQVWADGTKLGPDLPAMRCDKLKWLTGQSQLTKYLKWYRVQDPDGFAAWIAANPNYRSQAGLPALPKEGGAA